MLILHFYRSIDHSNNSNNQKTNASPSNTIFKTDYDNDDEYNVILRESVAATEDVSSAFAS